MCAFMSHNFNWENGPGLISRITVLHAIFILTFECIGLYLFTPEKKQKRITFRMAKDIIICKPQAPKGYCGNLFVRLL